MRDLADDIVINERELEDLHGELVSLLKENIYFDRPGWDQYFMDMNVQVGALSGLRDFSNARTSASWTTSLVSSGWPTSRRTTERSPGMWGATSLSNAARFAPGACRAPMPDSDGTAPI